MRLDSGRMSITRAHTMSETNMFFTLLFHAQEYFSYTLGRQSPHFALREICRWRNAPLFLSQPFSLCSPPLASFVLSAPSFIASPLLFSAPPFLSRSPLLPSPLSSSSPFLSPPPISSPLLLFPCLQPCPVSCAPWLLLCSAFNVMRPDDRCFINTNI